MLGLGRIFSKETVVGVDIGSRLIKVVQAEPGRSEGAGVAEVFDCPTTVSSMRVSAKPRLSRSFCSQARTRGGWAAFTPGPAAGMTKEAAERAFGRAGVSPDEIEFPAWYQPAVP